MPIVSSGVGIEALRDENTRPCRLIPDCAATGHRYNCYIRPPISGGSLVIESLLDKEGVNVG